MSEWISVKDRLPEPDKDVLLCSGLGNFRMAVGGKYELDGGIAHREKRREKLNMKNKNLRRLRCLVKAQTLWHLERLAYLPLQGGHTGRPERDIGSAAGLGHPGLGPCGPGVRAGLL